MNIMEFLRAAAERDEPDDEADKPMPEAVINDLRARFVRYGKNPFLPGDLVTPNRNSNVRGAGQPYIVLEVRACEPTWMATSPKDVTSCSYGMRQDMRVLGRERGGALAAYWVESYEFVPYTGEGA